MKHSGSGSSSRPLSPPPCSSPCYGDDHNEDEAASWAD